MNSKILSASEAKIIFNTFCRNVKFLEIYLEKTNPDWSKRGQVKDQWEGWGKVWKDKQLQEIKDYLFASFYGMYTVFKINKKKDGISDLRERIKQDFYCWFDILEIEKYPSELKEILFTFHEILEGRGDKWAEEKAEKSEKEVASWSKEKLQFEMERGFNT